MNLFENIIAKGNIPWTSSLFNSVSSNPQITGNTGGGITPQSLSQAKSSIDVANQIKQKYGFDDKDIQFLRLAKEKGYDSQKAMEYLQNKKVTEKQWPDLGIMGNIKEGAIGAFRSWEQIPSIIWSGLWFVGNVIGTWLDYITPWLGQGAKDLWKRIEGIGNDITMAGMTGGWSNPLTQNQINARKFWGQMALTAPIGGGYIAWSKWLWSLAFRSWVVWGWFWGSQAIVDNWSETTIGDIGKGIVTWGVTGSIAWPVLWKVVAPAIWGIVSKTGKYWTALIKWGGEWLKKSISRDINAIKTPWVDTITRNIPKAVVRRDLWFTPTERAKIEKITGQDEGTYILSKWLAGKGKEELAEVFMKQSDDMYNGITKQLANTNARVQSPVAKEALLDILDQLESSPKIARAYAKDIEWVKAMLARNDFSLSELNNIRRAYDKVNTGMFTVQGKARSWLENAIDVKVRQDLSSQLQKEAKKYGVDVKAMNTELRAWLEMKDALLRRLSQEERNNFIGLQDLGVSAILSGGEPVSAVATIVAKKYAEKVAPWLAQKAYNLNKKPNVTRNVSRGNTITPRNKSSRLGISSNNRTPVVSDGIEYSNIPWAKKLSKEYPYWKTVRLWDKPKVEIKGTPLLPERTKTAELAKLKEIKELKRSIANATEAARYWGTGNARIETGIQEAIKSKKITQQEAIDIVNDIYDDVIAGKSTYKYINEKKLEEYLNSLYSKPIVKPSPQVKPVQKTVKANQPNTISDKMASYKEIISNKTLPEETRVFAMRDMYELMIKEWKARGMDIANAKEQLKKVNWVIKEKYIDSRKLWNLMKKTERETQKAKETIEYLKPKPLPPQKTVKPKK